MSSDSHQAPANPKYKRDRLELPPQNIVPSLFNDAVKSPHTNPTPLQRASTDSATGFDGGAQGKHDVFIANTFCVLLNTFQTLHSSAPKELKLLTTRLEVPL